MKEELDPTSTKTVLGFNRNDATGNWQQWGGTGIVTTLDACAYVMDSGWDKSKLGRWCWKCYHGRDGIMTRIVSFYRPCCNTSGEQLVYQQHVTYFNSIGDQQDPQQAFLDDFEDASSSWIQKGEQLLIGGDINDDVMSPRIQQFFQKHGLRNLIFTRHPASQAPETYFRNTQEESVDGLWATENIVIARGGYLDYPDLPGDHRGLWGDIPITSFLGHQPPPLQPPNARRLKLQDDRVVQRYLKIYSEWIQ